jgi:hypothetical protein
VLLIALGERLRNATLLGMLGVSGAAGAAVATPVATKPADAVPAADEIVVTDQRRQSTKASVRLQASTSGRPAFASFEVSDQKDPASPTFIFSAARATVDDPVMISTPGRELTDADATEYRTSLQRHWLSVNVPGSHEFADRVLTECDPPGEWEFPYCDLYSFVDPETGAGHDFYIFTGNWNYDL